MSTSTREIPSARGRPRREVLPLTQDWAEVFTGRGRASFVGTLRQWLPSRRWFRGKARTIKSVSLHEQIPVSVSREKAFLLLFQVHYTEGCPELYVLPLACAFGQQATALGHDWPQLILTRVSFSRSRQSGVLYDAIVSQEFCHALLALTAERQKVVGHLGDLEAEPTGLLRRIRREQGLDIEASVSKAEQSNSSIIYGNSVILKFFRRLDAGVNPELEIERFLSARGFAHSPSLAGALEYHDEAGQTSAVAVLTSFVPGCHDAWEDTLSALRGYYQRVQDQPANLRQTPPAWEAASPILGENTLPGKPADLIGAYLQDARTLGRRTASLHLTLASDPTDPAFRPEPWTAIAQQALFESLRDLTQHNFQLLRQQLARLAPDSRVLAQRVLSLEQLVLNRFQRVVRQPFAAMRIRTHGDYHLGQVLHHGADFLIIDFEGEPSVSLEERRSKQSPLRDVAGMIHSFFYAANAALRELPRNRFSGTKPETKAAWARYWSVWVSTTFLRSYLETAGSAPFLPEDESALKIMLDVELLRKAVYELGYELNNRPDWVNVSFQVLLDLLDPANPL